jgi:hypothetical protein
VQTIKFVGVVVFEKKRFEAKVDSNAYMYAYTYERPCTRTEEESLLF